MLSKLLSFLKLVWTIIIFPVTHTGWFITTIVATIKWYEQVGQVLAHLVEILLNCLTGINDFLDAIITMIRLGQLRMQLMLEPVSKEIYRFSTVLYPKQVVWYSPQCVLKWLTPETSEYTAFGNKIAFLTELRRVIREPAYVRIQCVAYMTYLDLAILLLCIAVVLIFIYVLYRVTISFLKMDDPLGRVLYSKILSKLIKFTTQPLIDVSTIRKIFSNTIPIVVKETNNHTHPRSAAVRSASSGTISLICSMLGAQYAPYYCQLSKSDLRNGRDGCRSYYWAKDLGVDDQGFEPPPNSVIAMVDTDMYVDMPTMLSQHVHTYMISTFQPTEVASECGEYSFTFDKDNVVNYTVSGGARYSHQIWNYAGDVIKTSSRVWFGFGVRTTAYNVDRRQISKHHQIVCLTPSKTFISPLIDLGYWLGGDALRRYDVSRGEFLRLRTKTKTDTIVSTALVGHTTSANISVALDDTLATTSKIGKIDLSIAQVKSVINDIDSEEAAILVAFHRNEVAYSEDVVFPVEHSIKHYQYEPHNFDPDALHQLQPFMSPIINPCYSPDKNRASDNACINGRIINVKASEDITMTEFDRRCMEEFVERLVPDNMVGKGVPVDLEEVYDRQSRPSQRFILDQASMKIDFVTEDKIKSFQKAEAYSEIKDPRNISTVPGSQKLHYSAFMYAFTEDVLKHQEWYAFSKTPKQIANRVAALCYKAKFVVNTDLNRMDGRVSVLLRMLETMAVNRWISKNYAAVMAELQASQHNQKGITAFGVKYDTGFSRLSGSPETSPFNTLCGAFMGFKALRGTRVDGEYLTADQAWAQLGAYGGDDGVTPDVDPEAFVKSCQSVGQKLKIDIVMRGDVGVTFLSRLYGPQVWFGSSDSMCDVSRQLAKLHVTHKLSANVSPMDKLLEKMSGFYLTDRNTPIIGELARYVVATYGLVVGRYNLANYFSKYPENDQFPNEDSGWMEVEVLKQLPTFDFKLFKDWLNMCATIDPTYILKAPLCVVLKEDIPETKLTVVVDGDVVPATGLPAKYALCKHLTEGCKFGDKCNHLVKSNQVCQGRKCRFTHGERPNVGDNTGKVASVAAK